MKQLASIVILLTITIAAVAQVDTVRLFGVKSGIAKSETMFLGKKTDSTTCFDNYGALMASKTFESTPGAGEMEMVTISKNGRCYIVNNTTREVQEVPVENNINYLNLNDAVVKKYNITETGKEVIANRECTVYTEEISDMGPATKVTVWVWKGFPMKTVTAAGGINITVEVVEFTENAPVLPRNFDVPTFK